MELDYVKSFALNDLYWRILSSSINSNLKASFLVLTSDIFKSYLPLFEYLSQSIQLSDVK